MICYTNKMGTLPSAVERAAHERRFVGYTRSKCPIDPKTGLVASLSDPNTWGTYSQAVAWADAHGGYVGVLPGNRLVIDLDGAIEDGQLTAFAKEWLERIGGDAEVSVSGEGIHLYPDLVWDDELRELIGRRKVFHNVPIEGVEFRTGNMGTILNGPLRWVGRTSPAEQTAAVKDLLRSLQPEPEVIVHATFLREAKRRGVHGPYLDAKFLRTLDPMGTGFVREEVAITELAKQLSHLKHPRQAAERRIRLFCASPFGERRQHKDAEGFSVRYRNEEAIAAAWGVERGRRIKVQVRSLTAFTPTQLAYLIGAAVRNGNKKHRLPTARATRHDMTGVSVTTQWRAEKRAKVEVVPQYHLLIKPDDEVPFDRRAVETRYGRALRMGNSTFVSIARLGCGSTRSKGRVQTGAKQLYFSATEHIAASATQGALVFQGFGMVGGRLAGLWVSA